jgi:hypothetical protein
MIHLMSDYFRALKAPVTMYLLPFWAELFPGATYIHVVRFFSLAAPHHISLRRFMAVSKLILTVHLDFVFTFK